MEKVKLPKKIVEFLEGKTFASATNGMQFVLNDGTNNILQDDWIFQEGNLIKLARALEYGYEVEVEYTKGQCFVFENRNIKWTAIFLEEKRGSFHYRNAFSAKNNQYDYSKSGCIPNDGHFVIRLATEDETEELKRILSFIKAGRKVNEFKPCDIGITSDGDLVEVIRSTQEDGKVDVLAGNENEGYAPVKRMAKNITLRYPVECRVDLND